MKEFEAPGMRGGTVDFTDETIRKNLRRLWLHGRKKERQHEKTAHLFG